MGWQIVPALVLAGGCLAPAQAAEPLGLSGYELSNGTSDGNLVRRVLFAGTLHDACNCFVSQGDDGTWVATVDRTAGGGIGGSVTIVGGRITIDKDGADARTFRITGGYVNWPASLTQDIGCGPGVAVLRATVSPASYGRSLDGCLDDTHLDPRQQPFVFPPRIWGTLS